MRGRTSGWFRLLLGVALCAAGCQTSERTQSTVAESPPANDSASDGAGEDLRLPSDDPDVGFVFAYFTGDGRAGLRLAGSRDALQWTPLAIPPFAPAVGQERLLRDPSLARGPDGVFHLVWMVGWSEPAIGHASSTDLRHWSAPETLPVMQSFPGARNAWAPEVFWDEPTRQYLILWASTVIRPGPPPVDAFLATADSSEDHHNHRLYCTTTRDWQRFTPTQVFFDPGFSVIDGCVFRAGGRYVLVAKNATCFPQPAKNLVLASSLYLTGPFSPASAPLAAAGAEVAGPSVLRVGQGWTIYFDRYTADSYGAVFSLNLARWQDITSRCSFPPGARHGAMLRVPRAILDDLLRAGKPPPP